MPQHRTCRRQVAGHGGRPRHDVREGERARRQSDAMACRGFDGTFSVERERVITPAGIAYLVALACAVICFVYLEGAVA